MQTIILKNYKMVYINQFGLLVTQDIINEVNLKINYNWMYELHLDDGTILGKFELIKLTNDNIYIFMEI